MVDQELRALEATNYASPPPVEFKFNLRSSMAMIRDEMDANIKAIHGFILFLGIKSKLINYSSVVMNYEWRLRSKLTHQI